jgi:hypothetical protein
MDAINVHMARQGQPMLSAVVVSKEKGKPWWGFFDRARGLGRYTGGDQQAFFDDELRKVFECWSHGARV